MLVRGKLLDQGENGGDIYEDFCQRSQLCAHQWAREVQCLAHTLADTTLRATSGLTSDFADDA